MPNVTVPNIPEEKIDRHRIGAVFHP